MDITFSKTTAYKLGETPGGRYAKNPRWPPLETEKAISRILLRAKPIVTPLFSLNFLPAIWAKFPLESPKWQSVGYYLMTASES